MRKTITLILLLAATGCGPEQTNRQAEENERNTVINQQKAELEPFEGDFDGVMRDIDGRRLKATLRLRSFDTTALLVSRYERIFIPNLVGSVIVEGSEGKDSSYIYYTFDQGVYDSNTNSLKLLGKSAAGIGTFIELKPSDNKVTGEIIAGRLVQTVEFTRRSKK